MKYFKLLCAIAFLFTCSLCISQTNRYLDELGKSFKINVIKDWSNENKGIALERPNDERYYGVALPQFGAIYGYDYNKVNKYTKVTSIEFGTASTMNAIYTSKAMDQFRDNRWDLPFGLKIGMSRNAVEAITGRLLTRKLENNQNIEEVSFTNLPGFRFLDIIFRFHNNVFTYLKIEVSREGASSYRRRLEDLNHPIQMTLKEAITEKRFTNIRLNINFFLKGLKNLIENKSTAETLKNNFFSDSQIHIDDGRKRLVWCISRVIDKESFFDQFLQNLSVGLDPSYRNGGWSNLSVASYKENEINEKNYFFHSPIDGNSFKLKNSRLLFHAYHVPSSNEIVLNIYSPGERGRIEKIKYLGICKPENSALLLSDEEYLIEKGINLDQLKARFSKNSGNALLRILGGGESYSAVGFETMSGYNQKTSKNWLKGIALKFDKNFSRSVFKGELPFGLKKGMNLSKIKNIFPGAEYTKAHSKKDWFTTYENISVTENLSFSVTMSFRKGKLGRLVVELDEEAANSRIWKILKSKIFPSL